MASASATRQALRIDGRNIAVSRAGEGERAIVLVHGFGSDRMSWMFNSAALSRAATVLALDLPGHGASSTDVGDGSVAFLGRILRGVVAESGLSRVHLVGHSLGGAVALRVALDAPDLVGALTLIAPVGFGPDIDRDFIEGLLAMRDGTQAMRVLRMLVARPERVSPQMAEGLLAQKRRPGVEEAWRTIATASFPQGRQRIAFRDEIGDLTMPVQMIWGEADRILAAAQTEGLPENVPLHRVPAAGHLPQMEAPQRVNGLIEAFL